MTLYAVPSGPGDDSRPSGPSEPASGRESEAALLVELVHRSAEGDQDAFAELYDKTSGRIYGIVWRVLRSADHAAEVTQEVYTEVWRQATRFDAAKGSPLAWIATMAHRRAVDRVRSVTREVARDENYAVSGTTREVDHVWEGVEQRMEAQRVRKGMESLTPIQREALTLAYFGGFTQTEIATRLQLPLGTVKTRVRDGLIRLRDALGVEA
jgi:RNA polymerase sigma-70 factor (ECF subfamily)